MRTPKSDESTLLSPLASPGSSSIVSPDSLATVVRLTFGITRRRVLAPLKAIS